MSINGRHGQSQEVQGGILLPRLNNVNAWLAPVFLSLFLHSPTDDSIFSVLCLADYY